MSQRRSYFVNGMIAFALGLLFAPSVTATEKSEDIDTNRPSFMNSPLVVPKGSLQLENGALYSRFQHGQTVYDVPETEVRLGLSKSTELQLFVLNYQLLHQQSSQRTGVLSDNQYGVSDIDEAGLKVQLPRIFKSVTAAVIGGVNIPVGSRFISGSGVQPVVRLPWGKALNEKWTLMGQQSLILLNSGDNLQWQNFWMLNRAIGKRTAIFGEYGGFYTEHFAPNNIAHFGAVRKLNKNTQVDLQFGFGLNNAAPAAFIGGGYSFRFDRLPLIEHL